MVLAVAAVHEIAAAAAMGVVRGRRVALECVGTAFGRLVGACRHVQTAGRRVRQKHCVHTGSSRMRLKFNKR